MDNIEHLTKIIKNNLDAEKDSFYLDLRDNDIINVAKFDILTNTCFDLHNKNLTKIQRLEIAVIIWETAFHVESLISSHHNHSDTYKIKNLKPDDLHQIHTILFYICNWFTYNRNMEKELLKIGSWT